MRDLNRERDAMVEFQIAARGIHDPRILEAFRSVPREAFVPDDLREFAYEDTPLPIAEGQTISQPYIVAWMIQALDLGPHDRVLEIGAGSGYAAAVLSRIAAEVYTVERHDVLARSARRRLQALGYHNVHVLHGDGTLGWPEHAPFDAITVAAGGPEVPQRLCHQLALGGRLVIPVGETPRLQKLVRVRRAGSDQFQREELGDVCFVPLIGAEGWSAPGAEPAPRPRALTGAIPKLLREVAEPIHEISGADLGPLADRIGDARVVLLGECTHGTSEFYRLRARITQELVSRHGFNLIAVEADWPDAAQIDRHVRGLPARSVPYRAFTRFPAWMWRNQEVRDFTEWLRDHNQGSKDPRNSVSFHGLDLYSLHSSIHAVLEYLDRVDPEAGRLARRRYGCLTPWEGDPASYGRAALTGRYRLCEQEVLAMLMDLFARRTDYASRDGEQFLDALQNARLVANAERYYRVMYYGSRESWNLRDTHMFETLEALLAFRGENSRAVVWEHNSHIGDASATEMGARGEDNVGRLCRERYGKGAALVGFGTDHGTVAAASDWDLPMEVMQVRAAHPASFERLFHDSRVPAFAVHLREPHKPAVRDELSVPRLERAIGVVYKPESELLSHYFQAMLARQFDEYVWVDATSAVHPLPAPGGAGGKNPLG